AGKEAENRLLSRQQDTKETIQRRMSTYTEQISHQDEFDHILTNTDVKSTSKQLLDILASS
ncbi:MAG TPA: guanylate kinase, partial [Gammaproteobacteria bacterium]|nr:guanylate kinase [Gammaproteobacteria bacterium]